ncbi:MAG: queuosine precursor transporter [Patescibacteria group bacterium]|nr:queuosine precursor transporter [Patescibacteria group bacterium]
MQKIKINLTRQDKIYILFGIFIASLLCANFLGAKITSFTTPKLIALTLNFIFWPVIVGVNSLAAIFTPNGIFNSPFLAYNFFDVIHVSVGILVVPIMFLTTDIMTEVLGKKNAQRLVNTALLVMLFALAVTLISVLLPPDPTRQYFSQENYVSIFGISIRMTIASILAFVLAQHHDIWAFNLWKKITRGKWLWIRNNASTVVSQLIDSTVFMFIAFYLTSPNFTAVYIWHLILPYWIFKIFFSFIETPFCYAGVKWLKESESDNE